MAAVKAILELISEDNIKLQKSQDIQILVLNICIIIKDSFEILFQLHILLKIYCMKSVSLQIIVLFINTDIRPFLTIAFLCHFFWHVHKMT